MTFVFWAAVVSSVAIPLGLKGKLPPNCEFAMNSRLGRLKSKDVPHGKKPKKQTKSKERTIVGILLVILRGFSFSYVFPFSRYMLAKRLPKKSLFFFFPCRNEAVATFRFKQPAMEQKPV